MTLFIHLPLAAADGGFNPLDPTGFGGLLWTLVIFVLAGRYADSEWGGSPWGTLIGAVFGFTASTTWLYRQIYSKRSE